MLLRTWNLDRFLVMTRAHDDPITRTRMTDSYRGHSQRGNHFYMAHRGRIYTVAVVLTFLHRV